MNIYFSCSITGGRKDEEVYQALVNYLLENHHEVPTAHLSSPDVLALEAAAFPEEVYLRDVAWVRGCQAVVAEVSTPSHGVGYEIALALSLGKPVLCCYRSGVKVSKMITGNNSRGLSVHAYTSIDQAVEIVRNFLAGINSGTT
jgi:2'-deoxynucleoside 5'-phosphate N-hydrolase